jgi:hypothetical protein
MTARASWLVPALFAASCAVATGDGGEPEPPTADVPPEDLVEVSDIKGDGGSFRAADLMDDASFTDDHFMTRAEVQAFFESTPYGSRSFLADFSTGGRSVAELIVNAAADKQISPIVLLVKLQVETGLVSKTVTPSAAILNRAMGCGCPDGGSCASATSGFEKQIRCAADVFRDYLDDLDSDGATIAGWKVGTGKRTLDGVWVSPRNRATAALYTYTPWVLPGSGGNWLFWNIYKRYTRHLLEGRPNYHWVGGPCDSLADCPLDGGQCLTQLRDGLCTQPCVGTCPDSNAPFTSVTFCADLGSRLGGSPQGYCLSRCDDDLYQTNSGCRPGFLCDSASRFGDPGVTKWVCWPQ